MQFAVFFSLAQQPNAGQGHQSWGTPLDEGSARRTELYLTTHNTHKRQTSMHLARFEPAIPESHRPQTLAYDQSASGVGTFVFISVY
jgi:hypothetical protein